MKHITKMMVALALGCSMTSGIAQAASIQSMTIEEIGVASGGFGTSAAFPWDGGFGDWIPPLNTTPYTPSPASFISAGSADGAIIMGTTQANGAFTLGTVWGGLDVQLNTLNGAPSGTIENGVMSLDFSGLSAEFTTVDLTFDISPNVAAPLVEVLAIDATHYYYTASWIHLVNDDVYHTASGVLANGWNGSQIFMYMEGVATLAPVPEAETYAMMLAGLGLVGFMAHRRRKLL